MRKPSTKTRREPSKASLEQIPEVTLVTHRVLGRGRHVARAESSFEALFVDKKLVTALGGPEAIVRILETLAASLEPARKKQRRTA
jgi:hypothetical protein